MLLAFCSWVALLCQGLINLLVPILLYRQALLVYPGDEDQAWRAWRRVQNRRVAWLTAVLGGRAPAWRGTAQLKPQRSFSEGLEMVPFQGREDGEGSPRGGSLGERWGHMSSPEALPREWHADASQFSLHRQQREEHAGASGFAVSHHHHAVHQQQSGLLSPGKLHESPPLLERDRPPRSAYHDLSEGGPPEGPPDYRTRAVPPWLGADPLTLATSMAVFVFIAIFVSIVFSIFL